MSTATKSRMAAAAAGRKEIEAAEQEHRQAAELLAALKERVRAGDPGVKPAELRDAQGLVDYAALRVDAAKRRAEQLETDARHQLYAEIGAEARAMDLGDDQVIGEVFAAALAAVHRLYAIAEQRAEQLAVVVGKAAAVVEEADRHGERDLLRAAGVHNVGQDDIVIKHEDGTASHVTAVRPHLLPAAVIGRLFADQKQRLQREAQDRGESFYGPPWSGELPQAVSSALTITAREFPDLLTVPPAAVRAAAEDVQ